MSIQTLIEEAVKEGFNSLYQTEIPSVEFQATRKEFEGDKAQKSKEIIEKILDNIKNGSLALKK